MMKVFERVIEQKIRYGRYRRNAVSFHGCFRDNGCYIYSRGDNLKTRRSFILPLCTWKRHLIGFLKRS